jgi:pyroglutamyl-peptidase
MLLTGFGPFRNFPANPSGLVAQAIDPEAIILPVQYGKVEQFARSIDTDSVRQILSIGVAKHLTEPVFELYAHNVIGAERGVGATSQKRTVIKRSGPQTLGQTFLSPKHFKANQVPLTLSYDPGSYLCNFILYSLLARYPQLKIGFVHIPPLEVMSLDEQTEKIRRLIEFAQSDPSST